jgi:hypothetical protein
MAGFDLTDPENQNHLPLYAKKEAENMMMERRNDKVLFLLITPNRVPTECVWLDPYLGFIAVKGREDAGFVRVKDLEPGTLIFNQRYESEDR